MSARQRSRVWRDHHAAGGRDRRRYARRPLYGHRATIRTGDAGSRTHEYQRCTSADSADLSHLYARIGYDARHASGFRNYAPRQHLDRSDVLPWRVRSGRSAQRLYSRYRRSGERFGIRSHVHATTAIGSHVECATDLRLRPLRNSHTRTDAFTNSPRLKTADAPGRK